MRLKKPGFLLSIFWGLDQAEKAVFYVRSSYFEFFSDTSVAILSKAFDSLELDTI